MLNESLSAPSSSVKPAVVTNGSSLTKIRTSPTITLPQTDPPLSESAARPTTLSVDSTSQHSNRKITQDVRNMSQNVGNGRQFFRSNLEPAQAAKRPLESHTLPVMKVGTTLRFPVIDLTQSQNGPTTTLPVSQCYVMFLNPDAKLTKCADVRSPVTPVIVYVQARGLNSLVLLQ